MNIFSNSLLRALSIGACVGLLGLLAACGLMETASQPSATATDAPVSAAPTNTSASATPALTTATTTAAPTSAATTTSSNLQTVKLEIVQGDSEARYRVREQLARLSFPSDAVGSTKAVTGTIVARSDGTIDSAQSKFQVDLSTLKSDENQRDNFIKMNTLQTRQYPYATFVPTKVEGLSLPPQDSPVSFKLTGALTIRNVTKPVTWDVTGTVKGDEATGTATTSFTFDYFNLTKPSVFTVLSVEDTIKLELDLHLRRVAAQ